MSTTTVSSAMISSGVLPAVHRNDIINGGLVVNRENVTAPADAAFTIGELFLHNGEGTPLMSLETDGPQGTRPWQKMVLDANDQGGLAYIVPNDTVQDYIANGKMSFGIQLKTTAATIANARIGILKWTGTADAVTKELVGTWASDGTSPTLATSLSYENTPANLGLTTSWARHVVEDVTVDSDTKNIILFVWTDDGTITASDVIGFSEWQLNPGSTVNAFSQPDTNTVLNQISYYFQYEVYASNGSSSVVIPGAGVANAGTTSTAISYSFKRMRATPVITSSAADTFDHTDGHVTGQLSNIVFHFPSHDTVRATGTTTSMTAHTGLYVLSHANETAFLSKDARIGV
tara:strand:+ start:113 stop:1153 length:1041 start_codon:yes stop_codon:yes gene_type:complete